MNARRLTAAAMLVPLFAAMLSAGGCDGKPVIYSDVPRPLHLLLPRDMKFHFFTKTNRTFDEQSGGVRGMEVYLQMLDAYDDANKAFGTFRIEMYSHKPNATDPRGEQVAIWTVDLTAGKKNLLHWDGNARAYRFKLEWARGVPVGQKFVLVAVYSSPFRKDRLTARQVFISGE